MKPFNREKALAGSPVMTAFGQKVMDLAYYPSAAGYLKLIGCVGGCFQYWTAEGKHYKDGSPSPEDLVMGPEKRTAFIVLDLVGQLVTVCSTSADACIAAGCVKGEYVEVTYEV